MGLREEIREYTQPDGLISPDRFATPDSTGNGLSYTALYYDLLVRRGETREEDHLELNRIIRSCQVQKLAGLHGLTYTGLFHRSPTKTGEQNGPDDYKAIAGVCRPSSMNIPEIVDEIIEHGEESGHFYPTKWIYNNLEPGKWTNKAWMGRQGPLIAHFYFAAGELPPAWLRKWWRLGILLGADSDKKEDRINAWWMIKTNPDPTATEVLDIECWQRGLLKHFPGGMRQAVCKEMKNSQDHPLVKYWID